MHQFLEQPECDVHGRINLLERILVLFVLAITGAMWYYSIRDSVLLHLYYIPVVVTGFFLGQYRARLMAFLCIMSASVVFIPIIAEASTLEIPLSLLIAYVLWTSTISLLAILVGKLSDGWRQAMNSLREEHAKDVLTDALTGIANRRAYEFELARRIAQWERDGTPLTFLMVDIDYFKKLNDRYGHPAGDAVLQAVAQVLQTTIRKADLVARYGGEEFGVILPGISFSEAKDVSERIRSLIEAQRIRFNDLILRVTTSIGFAQIQPGEAAESFTKRADAALYTAKEAGRNRVYYHDGKTCLQLGSAPEQVQLSAPPVDDASLPVESGYTDETCGLPVQRVFLEELRRRAAERSRYGTELVVAVVLIDSYAKTPRDHHRTQKSLLATVATLVCSQLRETDLVARYGVDTLAVLMPSTSLQGASFPLQRISARASVYQDDQYPGLSYSVSIGAAEVLHNELPGLALQNAEQSLVKARAAGGGRVEFHGSDRILVASQKPLEEEAPAVG